MITIHLRTYPENTALWSISIGVGADWYSGRLMLDQPASIPSQYAGPVVWLVASSRRESGGVIAEKIFRTAILEDGIIYGVYWEEASLTIEGSELEEERRQEEEERLLQRTELIQLAVSAVILFAAGVAILKVTK